MHLELLAECKRKQQTGKTILTAKMTKKGAISLQKVHTNQ